MSETWFRSGCRAWELLMEHAQRPIDPEIAVSDARFLYYEGGGLPSWPELAERWGWYSSTGKPSVKRVRLLIAAEEWRDSYQDARDSGKGRRGAGRGQARGRQRAGEGQAEHERTPDTDDAGAARGQPEGSPRAGEGQTEGYTRVDPPSPSPSPSPPVGGGVEGSLSEATEARPAPPPTGRGPLAERWCRVFRLRYGVEPALDRERDGAALRRVKEAVGDDLALFDAALAAFWLAVDQRRAWRRRSAETLTPAEMVEDLSDWLTAGRVALQRQALRLVEAEADPEPPPRLELVEAAPDAAEVWEAVCEYMRPLIGHDSVQIWLLPCRAVELTDEELVIAVDHVLRREWIADQYAEQLNDILNTRTVRLVVAGEEATCST